MAKFLIMVLAMTLVLLAPWPGLDRAYAFAFRSIANVVFGSVGSDGAVEFIANPDPAENADTQLVLRNRANGAVARAPMSVRLIAFVPTALALSLCVASPAAWRKRLIRAGVGILLIQGFVAIRVYLRLVDVFSGADSLAVFQFGPISESVVRWSSEVLAVSLLGSFVVPLLVWMAVAVSPGDWPATAENGSKKA